MVLVQPIHDPKSADLGPQFKELVADAIASEFWTDLLGHIKAPGYTIEEIVAEVASKLKCSRQTPLRWFKRTSFPSPNKFFLIAIALDLDIRTIKFRPKRSMILEGVCRVIERIRVKHLGPCPDPGRKISVEEYECLRAIFAQPNRDKLINKLATDDDKTRICKNVVKELETRRTPGGTNWSEEKVSLIYKSVWWNPYIVYEFNRPRWNFLDEI